MLKLGFVAYQPYDPDGVERYWSVVGPMFSNWVPTSNIPKSCSKALVIAEDVNFYKHYGIDLDSIQRAVEQNDLGDQMRYGASTITQQLVKNLFLTREKSYLRKSREIVGALLLDPVVDKKEQLTWYFNIVEFGPNIYGIDAAAKAYFDKRPRDLNTFECATLVAALDSPVKNYQAIKAGKASEKLQKKRTKILGYLE